MVWSVLRSLSVGCVLLFFSPCVLAAAGTFHPAPDTVLEVLRHLQPGETIAFETEAPGDESDEEDAFVRCFSTYGFMAQEPEEHQEYIVVARSLVHRLPGRIQKGDEPGSTPESLLLSRRNPRLEEHEEIFWYINKQTGWIEQAEDGAPQYRINKIWKPVPLQVQMMLYSGLKNPREWLPADLCLQVGMY